MKILLLDNYDSFTFNLVHILRELNINHTVYKHDAITIEEVNIFDKIIFSPGPGLPNQSGELLPIIKAYFKHKPMLGICLGHQAIAKHFGGTLEQMPIVRHGISSTLKLENEGALFEGIEEEIEVGRYHSWKVSDDNFPKELIVTSRDEAGTIMSYQHEILPIHGVQFHPESIMTPRGKEMISNFAFS